MVNAVDKPCVDTVEPRMAKIMVDIMSVIRGNGAIQVLPVKL
jgi:hypothetical protein